MRIFWSIALVVLLFWLVADGMARFRYKTPKAENRDRYSLVLIVVGNLVAWIIGISLAFRATGALHSVALQIAGLLVLLTGIALRSTAIMQLGRFHTPNVAILTDHQLMRTGLYRYVRHPSYLGALIAFLGLGMALDNWLSLVVIMGISLGIYIYRIHEEEQALSAAFGAVYRAYCLRTKRLIPGLY